MPARRHLPPTDALLVRPTRFTVQLLREEDCAVVMSRPGEIRIEYCRCGVLHASRQFQCAGLVTRQCLGEIGGITNIDAERTQPVCIFKSIGECWFYRLQKKQKASNDVRLRELRLVPRKECF